MLEQLDYLHLDDHLALLSHKHSQIKQQSWNLLQQPYGLETAEKRQKSCESMSKALNQLIVLLIQQKTQRHQNDENESQSNILHKNVKSSKIRMFNSNKVKVVIFYKAETRGTTVASDKNIQLFTNGNFGRMQPIFWLNRITNHDLWQGT